MHAYISGRLEEIEIARDGRFYGLQPDQVLIKKDFILMHPDRDPNGPRAREMDRLDHVERGRMPRIDPQPRTAPGQPPLPDHRHDLPEDPASAVNQRQAQAGVRNPQLNQLLAAFRAGDSGAVSRAFNDISQSPQAQAWLQPGRDQLAAQAAQPPGQQEAAQSMQAPEPARG